MKKLFFTAIAIIAFSGVSIAGTIQEKDEAVIGSCMQVYAETYQDFVDAGFPGEASSEAAAAYGECLIGN